MRNLWNLFVTGLCLWAAARLFPDVVQIDGLSTVVIATLLLYVVTTIVCITVMLLLFGILFAGAAGYWNPIALTVITIVVVIIIAIFTEVIALGILTRYLPGFAIIGFWPKAGIAFVNSIVTVPAEKQNRD